MKNILRAIAGSLGVLALGAVACMLYFFIREQNWKTPEELLVQYMNYICEQNYEAMYSMLDAEDPFYPEKEQYIERNANIYEGIEIENLNVSNIVSKEQEEKKITVSYTVAFDTVAGNVHFDNQAIFVKKKDGYQLRWRDSLIFPDLLESDKVQVRASQAERGKILDRNGKALAGTGTASSVGIVPEKIEDKENAFRRLSDLLEVDIETIESKLEADWVKSDSFVPIATIPKVEELDLLSLQSDEALQKEYERQKQLLEIPGVMMTDEELRSYGLKEAAAHLIGYVQSVTAEDLEEHPDEGYRSDSVIGRSGLEGLFEKELKGKDGCEISIVDKGGNLKTILAGIPKEDGQDISLTIDSDLQKALYEQFQEDPGCSVAIQPYTGEVLALVSTPSYDNNAFIKGLSSQQWTTWNEDENKPLYNRFRQVWCPGSTFKLVVAGIGLQTGLLNPNEDFGNEGLSWQKDVSWGSYEVTTLHAYEPVIMKNALLYSDNIYFAKAALKIGAENLIQSLNALGFNQEIPFEIAMAQSQYSNTDQIETEIQLADSGYGQGQILVNPLHLASIYTAFLNEGNLLQPYLRYRENPVGEVWIPEAFTPDNVQEVMEGAKAVLNDPNGTGYAAHREDVLLAGKTGTAELKATKEDTSGTEIGWLAVFTAERDAEKPILLISMVEDVKNIGGCGYVIAKDKAVLDVYLGNP